MRAGAPPGKALCDGLQHPWVAQEDFPGAGVDQEVASQVRLTPALPVATDYDQLSPLGRRLDRDLVGDRPAYAPQISPRTENRSGQRSPLGPSAFRVVPA